MSRPIVFACGTYVLFGDASTFAYPPASPDAPQPVPTAAEHERRGKPHSPHHYYCHYWLYESLLGTSGEGRVKVVCLQENLAHGLGIAGRGVSTRGSLPILGNVLLRTDSGRLRLTATNLEVGINCWVPAKVDRKSTRLNSSHRCISYAVFCLKKKTIH